MRITLEWYTISFHPYIESIARYIVVPISRYLKPTPSGQFSQAQSHIQSDEFPVKYYTITYHPSLAHMAYRFSQVGVLHSAEETERWNAIKIKKPTAICRYHRQQVIRKSAEAAEPWEQ